MEITNYRTSFKLVTESISLNNDTGRIIATHCNTLGDIEWNKSTVSESNESIVLILE